jgi:hypothetical protein
MAEHRRTTSHVGEPPHAGIGQCRSDQCSGHPFGAVADEHRNRGLAAERLAGIPEARVAVTDVAQIDPVPTSSDQVRDRNRPDQVADHDRDCHIDAHR